MNLLTVRVGACPLLLERFPRNQIRQAHRLTADRTVDGQRDQVVGHFRRVYTALTVDVEG